MTIRHLKTFCAVCRLGGITRAAEELILTTSGTPSPFLSELPKSVVKERAFPKTAFRQLSLF